MGATGTRGEEGERAVYQARGSFIGGWDKVALGLYWGMGSSPTPPSPPALNPQPSQSDDVGRLVEGPQQVLGRLVLV